MICSMRSVRRQRGAAVLEFALVMPIFVLILYGLVTFGSVFYTQLSLSRAAADGARSVGMAQSVADYEALPQAVKDSIVNEVINSLAQSIIAPLGMSDFSERRNWVTSNVTSLEMTDNGSCGADETGEDILRVRVQLPFSAIRILPAIHLPLIGSMDAWFPQTLTGCAVAQL